MFTPRNLKQLTFSTSDPLMCRGACSTSCRLLKSTIISFVLLMLRERLLTCHHVVRVSTSSLLADSSLSVMRPKMVVSSANFTMRFELCVAAQSCVNKENRRGAEHTALRGA